MRLQTFREAFFQAYGFWTLRQRRKRWRRFQRVLNRVPPAAVPGHIVRAVRHKKNARIARAAWKAERMHDRPPVSK